MPARIPLLIFLLPLAFAVVAWKVPPAVFSDCGFGFLVWQSMEEGAPFNHLRSPDPEDISKDKDTYFTWWSPGQYLVPGLFLQLGFDYGQASVATVLICTWLGLLGWWLVARKAGATMWAQTLFVIALATFRYSTLPFRIYNGGEILLFAAAPWALLAIWLSLGRGFWWGVGATLGAALLLFIAKLSGILVLAVTILGASGAEWWHRRRVTPAMLGLAVGSILAASFFWWGWLSRGENPAAQASPSELWAAWLFPPAAAAFGGFTLQELLARFLVHPELQILPEKDLRVLSWILGPAGLALMFSVWRILAGEKKLLAWARLSAAQVLLQTGALAVLYTRGGSISFEERHLRYAGILVLLSSLMAADVKGARWRKIAAAAVGFFGVYGTVSFAMGTWQSAKSENVDSLSGLQQTVVKPSVLRYLEAEIKDPVPRMIFLPAAEVGLALPGWRIDAIQLDFTPRAVMETQERKGRVPELYVLLQERMEANGKADAVLDSFRDYQRGEWKRTLIDGTVIYHAKIWRP